MDYINLYHLLNKHLLTSIDGSADHIDPQRCYSTTRKGLKCSDIVKHNLKQTFNFSDAVFEDHDVNYMFHETVRKTNNLTWFTVVKLAY